jgi:hypothetical protein
MNKTFTQICDGVKAYEIKGLGCIVAAGVDTLWVEGASISEEGELVYLPPAEPQIEETPLPPKHMPSSIATVNANAFLQEMDRKNLTAGGEYGPLGPIIGKLRTTLKGTDDDSPVRGALGELLGLGDHGRYNTAAAVLAMNPEQMDQFNEVLNHPEPDIVREFVDRMIPVLA